MTFTKNSWSALVILLAFACGPSGPKGAKVTGSVTWEREPIAQGYIKFIPLDGKGIEAAGEIINGSYECFVEPGEKRVEVLANREKKNLSPEDRKQAAAMGMAPREQYIPGDYNANTKLKATVISGSNQFDFHLPMR